MRRQHDRYRQLTPDWLSQHPVVALRQRLLPLMAVIILMLVSLACACAGAASRSAPDRIVILTRLPTLTRTPLPSLTPTALAPAQAVALAAEATVADQQVAEPVVTATVSAIVDTQPGPSTGPDTSPTDDSAGPAGPTPGAPLAATATVTAPGPPTSTPTAIATEAPTPTNTPTAPPTATLPPAGWLFSGVRISPDPYDDGLLLHGDVFNNTGTGQELASITGSFFDAAGQPIANAHTAAYWPIATVPQGGRLPFELVIMGLQSVADLDLRVEAEPSTQTLSQDFEFFEITPSTGAGDYCLTGRLNNPGGTLESYLIVVAVLYDGQEQVINYGDDYRPLPDGLSGGQTTNFEVCIDPLNQEVARYELQAWGL